MDIIYYVAASLDGFIAKEDGDVTWLDELGIPDEGSGYEPFFATIDALLMGRKTYDQIETFGEWPYGPKPTWVCTHHPLKAIAGSVLQAETTPTTAIKAAQKLGINRLWFVGGGNLATSLLQSSHITHISVAQMPIILGRGIPLFAPHNIPTKLTLESVQQFGVFTQLTYKVAL